MFPPLASRAAAAGCDVWPGLIRKESLQMLRDPSSFMIAGVLPLLLLFIFGFGVTLDLRRVPIARGDRVAVAGGRQLPGLVPQLALFRRALRAAPPRPSSTTWCPAGSKESSCWRPTSATGSAAVRRPRSRCSSTAATPTPPGWCRPTSRACGRTGSTRKRPPETRWPTGPRPHRWSRPSQRTWFNPELDSQYALLPGAVAIVLTLIGTLLTSLVVAREWERGTMEALLATPITPGELLAGKIVPYFALGMIAMALSVAVTVFGFGVPFRGSVLALLGDLVGLPGGDAGAGLVDLDAGEEPVRRQSRQP